jgi:NTE family protein
MADSVAAAKACDLVCEGGGVKGIGLAGAYAALEAAGYEPKRVAGTSAGAITAALIAAGYTADELKEVVMSLDFRQFEDRGWEDRIPLLANPLTLLLDQGIYEGAKFLDWMRGMLIEKEVFTFGHLKTGSDDPRYAYRLQVVVSDISSRELLVLPRDAHKLGLDPDKLEVALAVRMSMSIPIFFEPVRVQNPATNWEHVLVDGGMLSNYPVWLFDSDDVPECPTFGLLLVEPNPKTPISERLPRPERSARGAKGVVQLLSGMVHTMMEAHDRLYVEKAQYARTIGIPTLGVGTTEFDLPRTRALELYESGRSAGQQFLSTWDFDAYVAAFRTGAPQSRRADLTAELKKQVASPA